LTLICRLAKFATPEIANANADGQTHIIFWPQDSVCREASGPASIGFANLVANFFSSPPMINHCATNAKARQHFCAANFPMAGNWIGQFGFSFRGGIFFFLFFPFFSFFFSHSRRQP